MARGQGGGKGVVGEERGERGRGGEGTAPCIEVGWLPGQGRVESSYYCRYNSSRL